MTARTKIKTSVPPPKRGSALTSQQQRFATALHEGAHAVTIYYSGGWVGPAGVRIDSDTEGFTATRIPTNLCNVEDQIIHIMAGFIAEHYWQGRKTQFHSLGIALDRQDPCNQNMRPESDWGTVFRLAATLPGDANRNIARLSKKASRLVRTPIVWSSIVAVAEALLNRSPVCARDVEAIICRRMWVGLKSPCTLTQLGTIEERFFYWQNIAEVDRRNSGESAPPLPEVA